MKTASSDDIMGDIMGWQHRTIKVKCRSEEGVEVKEDEEVGGGGG